MQTQRIIGPETIVPGYGERALFVGKTGSGKSLLAKALLVRQDIYPDVIIIDDKHEIYSKAARYISNPADYAKINEGLVIYHPTVEHDNLTSYELLFRLIYERRHTLVYIDELYAVCEAGKAPEHLKAIYTRGRSLGISAWGCAQRPAWVPLFTISETDRRYIFTLDVETDRRRMVGIVGNAAEEIVPEHQFLYAYKGRPQLMTYNTSTKQIEVLG